MESVRESGVLGKLLFATLLLGTAIHGRCNAENRRLCTKAAWATDTYEELDLGFSDKEQIDRRLLLQHVDVIKPRIQKSLEAQAARTRKKRKSLLRYGCATR